METTIDAAGRVVIPKAIRDAMGLDPGRRIDVVFADGRIEIEVAPVAAHIEERDGVLVAVPDEEVPPLTDEMIRATLEATRR